MNCSSCGNNNPIWLLILAFILSGKTLDIPVLTDGNTLPWLVALTCCSGGNNPISNFANCLLGGSSNNCGCGN